MEIHETSVVPADTVLISSSSEPIALALELYDIIIDFLHASPQTLLSCAVVCSAWRPSAQFHLFRDVRICADLDYYTILRSLPEVSLSPRTISRCEKFCAALRHSNHLIPLVRTLTVDACCEVLVPLTAVPFSHLNTLTLFYSQQYAAPTSDLEKWLYALFCIVTLHSRPALTRVEYLAQSISLTSAIFHPCANLKALVLNGAVINEMPLRPAPPPIPSSRPRIEYLRMANCVLKESNWLFASPSEVLDLSQLKHLDLLNVAPGYSLSLIAGLIVSVRATLEYLALDLTLPDVDLALLPRLRHLECYPHFHSFNMSRNCEVLGSLGPNSPVQTIVLWTIDGPPLPADFDAQIKGLGLPELQRMEVRVCPVRLSLVKADSSLLRELVFS